MDYKQMENDITEYFSGQSCLSPLMARELASLAVSVFQRHELRDKLQFPCTNPQTYADIEATVAEQNRKASQVAFRCGESVQFRTFGEGDEA